MKKLISILLVLPCLLIISCQKDKTSTNTNNTTASGNTSITPSSATSYFAILDAYYLQTSYGSFLGPVTKYGSAYFSSMLTSTLNSSTFIKVNKASLNGIGFKFSSFYYVDTTHTLNFSIPTWQVEGMGSIPSFTFTNNNAFPAYSGYSVLPDTVHINQGITILMNGISGSDQTTIGISDGSNVPGHTVAQILAAGATFVTFPASQLSSLNVTNAGFINVGCKKNNVQNVFGKDMNFVNNYQVNKTISIK